MKMNQLAYGAGALLIVLTAGCQQAGAPRAGLTAGPSLQERFARLDANGDGYITWEEAVPSRQADFRKMDASRDGRVMSGEYSGSLPFGRFDTNADRAISETEFLATHRGMFLQFDADRDARIALPEFGEAQRAAGR